MDTRSVFGPDAKMMETHPGLLGRSFNRIVSRLV